MNQILPQRIDNTYRGHPPAIEDGAQGDTWILLVKPIARTGTLPGIYINLVLLVVMIVGLALSLRSRADLPLQQSGSAPPKNWRSQDSRTREKRPQSVHSAEFERTGSPAQNTGFELHVRQRKAFS